MPVEATLVPGNFWKVVAENKQVQNLHLGEQHFVVIIRS
jgi:hypothetical protein